MASTTDSQQLTVFDAADIDVVPVDADIDTAVLETESTRIVAALMALDPAAQDDRQTGLDTVSGLAMDLQQQSARQLDLLNAPVHRIIDEGEAGGRVGMSLADLKVAVERVDPRRFDFEPGWFSRMLGYLPFIGTPLKRYLTRYESTRTVIDAIVRSLDLGREQLKRDNVVLADDQKAMRDATGRLAKAVQLGQLIDSKLTGEADALESGSEQHRFLSEDVLFPLRQRVIDLQQQLAVNQQGILATELISRNNRELVRGVDRAINVTARALKVAATVSIALADQKAVINKVNSVNEVTSDLIAGTAEQLKNQGSEIQKQAASAMLDINALKSAFADLDVAIDDVASFRSEALPKMAASVAELEVVTTKAAASIERLDASRRPEGRIQIDV